MDLNLCIQWDLRPAYGNFESVPQWLQYFIAAGSLKKYWTELSDLLLKGENVSLNLSKTQNKKGSDMLMEHLYHVKHYNQHTQLLWGVFVTCCFRTSGLTRLLASIMH